MTSSTTAGRARAHGAHHLARLADLMQHMREALRELAVHAVKAFASITSSSPGAARSDRPAWQSPYGPPRPSRR